MEIDVPHIVPDRREREVGAVLATRVRVDGDGGCGAIWRSQDVRAKDEETMWVERLSAAHERTPPVCSPSVSCVCEKLSHLTHQSSTSALPVNAWQIIMTLSRRSFSRPQVLYATGTSRSTLPHSRVKDGTVWMLWSMRAAKGDMAAVGEQQGVRAVFMRPPGQLLTAVG